MPDDFREALILQLDQRQRDCLTRERLAHREREALRDALRRLRTGQAVEIVQAHLIQYGITVDTEIAR